MSHSLTAASLEIFLLYADDAVNWSGTPLVGGNVQCSREARGNLTDLKRKGFITTFTDEGCVFISFTKDGVALAKEHGIDLSWI